MEIGFGHPAGRGSGKMWGLLFMALVLALDEIA